MTAPVRLDSLPPAGRRIVAALIEAERAAIAVTREAAPAVEKPGTAETGGTRDARPVS